MTARRKPDDDCRVKFCDLQDGHAGRHMVHLGELMLIRQGSISVTVEADRARPKIRYPVLSVGSMGGTYQTVQFDWPAARDLAQMLTDADRRYGDSEEQ